MCFKATPSGKSDAWKGDGAAVEHVFNSRHGPYVIASRLASGGMGEVFLAMNPSGEGFDRFVALKCLHPHFEDDPRVTEMFYREARLGALFRHKNLIRVSDVRKMNGRHTMVMEFAAGVTLRELLDRIQEREEAIPTQHVIEILQQISRGIHHAHTLRRSDGHRLNLVHRDLSPDNILLGFDGLVRVIDFGVAAAASKKFESGLAGKIAYMSPEQVRGESLDARSDLYSIGTIMWEMLVGHCPYPRTDRISALRMISEERLERPAELSGRPSSDSLDRVWARLHARSPEQRFNDAREVADALDVYGEQVLIDTGETLGGWIQRLFPHEAAEIRTTCEKILRAPTPSENTVDLSDPEFRTLAEQESLVSTIRPRTPAPPPPPLRSGSAASPNSGEPLESKDISGLTAVNTMTFSMEEVSRWRRQRKLLISTILVLFLCVVALGIAYETMTTTQEEVPVSFIVVVDPQEAGVMVDGVPDSGGSPSVVRSSLGNQVELSVTHPGYLPWNQKIRVEQSVVADGIRIHLQPDLNSPVAPIGEVRVNYIPSDARLILNGVERASQSPAKVDKIPLNTLHSLRLEREGYQTLFLDLRLLNDQPLEFDLQMTEGIPLARLSVESEPPADLFVDGQLVGKTPIEFLELPANTTYEVSLRAPGFTEWRRGVALQTNDVMVSTRLERAPVAARAAGSDGVPVAAPAVPASPAIAPSAPARRSDDDLPYRMIE